MSICCDCERESAQWSCTLCDVELCEGCWVQLHRVGKLKVHPKLSLSTSQATDLTAEEQAMKRQGCSTCERLIAALWCRQCKAAFCAHCHTTAEPEPHTLLPIASAADTPEASSQIGSLLATRSLQTELVHVNERFQVDLTAKRFSALMSSSVDYACSPVICFTGATHAGKSSMINSFMTYHRQEPPALVSVPGDLAPTTADIHLYQLQNPWTTGNLRLLDMEGFSAAVQLPRGLRWDLVKEEDREGAALERNKVVDQQYPRLAYFISDVLVYVVQGDLAVADHARTAIRFAQQATIGVRQGARKPALILIRNKCGREDVIMDVKKCTSQFLDIHDPEQQLGAIYSSVSVLTMPLEDYPELYCAQLGAFVELLRETVEKQNKFLRQNQMMLSEHRWCRLVAQAVESLNGTLDGGAISMRIIEPFDPIATKVWRFLNLFKLEVKPAGYRSLVHKAITIFTALVLAEERKQVNGRSMANDPRILQALEELGRHLKNRAPCTAEKNGVRCGLNVHNHGNCHAAESQPIRELVQKVVTFWVLRQDDHWPGSVEPLPAIDITQMYTTQYRKLTEESSLPKVFHWVIGELADSSTGPRLRKEKTCPFCLENEANGASYHCGLALCRFCSEVFHTHRIPCPLCTESCRLSGRRSAGHFKVLGGEFPTMQGQTMVTVWEQCSPRFWDNAQIWGAVPRNPSTIELFSVWQPAWQPYRLGLVMEHTNGGTLRDWIINGHYAPSWQTNTRILIQSLSYALKTLHASNIVHCGVTLSNIMVHHSYNDVSFKLAGFTNAYLIEQGYTTEEAPVITGNVQYMAPELFTTFRVSKAVDIYAFGVLLFEAVHAREPWPMTSDADVVRKNTRREKLAFGTHIPATIKKLISRCRKKPKNRPTAEALLSSGDLEFSTYQEYPDKPAFAPEGCTTLSKCPLYMKKKKPKPEVARSTSNVEPEIIPSAEEASPTPWLPEPSNLSSPRSRREDFFPCVRLVPQASQP